MITSSPFGYLLSGSLWPVLSPGDLGLLIINKISKAVLLDWAVHTAFSVARSLPIRGPSSFDPPPLHLPTLWQGLYPAGLILFNCFITVARLA
jgi:hypothetical protein